MAATITMSSASFDLSESLRRCHEAQLAVLGLMADLRQLIGPEPPPQPPRGGLFGEAEPAARAGNRRLTREDRQRAERLLGKIEQTSAPASRITPDGWGLFAAGRPQGLPVFACGQSAGSWHRAVHLACEDLVRHAGRGLDVGRWLPAGQADVERIRGHLDHEYGYALANSAAISPSPQECGPPHLDDARNLAVAPGTKGLGRGTISFRLLELLLRNEGEALSHAELGERLWDNEDVKADRIRKAVERLRSYLEAANWRPLANRIVSDRSQGGYKLVQDAL